VHIILGLVSQSLGRCKAPWWYPNLFLLDLGFCAHISYHNQCSWKKPVPSLVHITLGLSIQSAWIYSIFDRSYIPCGTYHSNQVAAVNRIRNISGAYVLQMTDTVDNSHQNTHSVHSVGLAQNSTGSIVAIHLVRIRHLLHNFQYHWADQWLITCNNHSLSLQVCLILQSLQRELVGKIRCTILF